MLRINRKDVQQYRIIAFLFYSMVLGMLVLQSTSGRAEMEPVNNYGLGKINLRSQSPVQSLRYTLPLLIPVKNDSGWSARITSSWSNIWANEPEFFLDYEMSDTIVTVSHTLNKRLSMSFEFENRSYFGGSMDGFIQGFHDLFGIGQDGRDNAPKNRKIIRLLDAKTGQIMNYISANELENQGLSLSMNYNVTDGNEIWPAVNFFGAIRYGLECAKICAENHPVDIGMGFGFAKGWSKKWYAYASLGVALYESRKPRSISPRNIPLVFEDETISGLFAISWHRTPKFAILAQYLYSGASITDIEQLDDPSHEVHFGFKWKTGYGLLEFALIENVITMSNSPDFGIHAGWSYHL